MINSSRIAILVCVCLMLSIYGCAKRPDEQIQQATDAMNQALELRAEEYAPSEWKSAKEAWDQAQDQLAKEQFAAASTSFVTARARLEKAIDAAKLERQSLEKQVNDLLGNVDTNYAGLKAGATPAKLAGGARKEYEAACADIDKRIAQIHTQVEQGDFIGAKTNAQGALQAIDYIGKKLQITGSKTP